MRKAIHENKDKQYVLLQQI